MKFNTVEIKPEFKGYNKSLLLKTPNYSPSGYVIGYFDSEYYTEDCEDITEYVEEWTYLN
jgi:hypothetical protein